MSHRDGYQPGVPCWVACVHPDAQAAAGFYGDLLGWETESLMPSTSPGEYVLCRLRGRDVAAVVSPRGAPPPPVPVWTTHVWVDNADAAAAKAVEAGGAVVGDAFDSPGGGRQAVLADPDGAVFCVWEPRERRGAQVVNEPGAWTMSQLNTRDPEGAKRFYGALFGWTTETFAMGDEEFTMWRLPGFVGGEPEQPVSREVVATMAPMSADRFGDDVPAHWAVDFWVADADAVAARASELGGRVVEGPFDMPGFRRVVVADPGGATLSASQLLAG
jgi:uncharacterized protein